MLVLLITGRHRQIAGIPLELQLPRSIGNYIRSTRVMTSEMVKTLKIGQSAAKPLRPYWSWDMGNVQRLDDGGLESLTKLKDSLRYSLAPCESKGISEKLSLPIRSKMLKTKFKIKRAFRPNNKDF